MIGGGIVGLSTAYWLSRPGPSGKARKPPLLLEAGHLAGRASGRNAGFLLTGSPEPFAELEAAVGAEAALAFWALTRENRDLLRGELIDSGRVECDFVGDGSWLAAVDSDGTGGEEHEVLRRSGERLAELGFDIEWREGAEVARASGSPHVHAALHQARDGALDPVLLCRGIAAAGGFPVRTGAWVHRLEPRGDRIEIVADGGNVVAERVVVALNAYAASLLPGLAPQIQPVRGQMVATEPVQPFLSGAWYLNRGFEYVRQLPDGSVLVGGGRQASKAAEVGYLEYPTAGIQGALERFVGEAYPALRGKALARRWAGVMAFTRNGLPLAGESSDMPGVLYAAGFNGHGMSLGFVTGRWLARRALGETDEPLLPPGR